MHMQLYMQSVHMRICTAYSWHSHQRIFTERLYSSKSFVRLMTSDINSSFNQNYPFSVIFTNTQISRSKSSFIYEYTRSARDDKFQKNSLNKRKFLYYNYYSYSNTITTNFCQHLLK